MRKFILPIFCALLFASWGDSDNTMIDPLGEPMMDLDLAEVGIDLTLWQELPGQNAFRILVSNSTAVECIESLQGIVSNSNNNTAVDISFDIMQQQLPCSSNVQFLESEMTLDGLNGEYDLSITVGNLQNTGKIRIENDLMEIKLSTKDGLQIKNQLIRKIPEDIAWGYTSLSIADSEDILALYGGTIISTMPNSTVQAELKDGYYGYFNYDKENNKLTMINEVDSWGQAMSLNINETGSWQQLEDILVRVSQMHPTMTYFFQNAEGEVLEN